MHPFSHFQTPPSGRKLKELSDWSWVVLELVGFARGHSCLALERNTGTKGSKGDISWSERTSDNLVLHMHMHMYLYMCTYICIYIYIRICMHIYIYILVYVCMYIDMQHEYIYIYMVYDMRYMIYDICAYICCPSIFLLMCISTYRVNMCAYVCVMWRCPHICIYDICVIVCFHHLYKKCACIWLISTCVCIHSFYIQRVFGTFYWINVLYVFGCIPEKMQPRNMGLNPIIGIDWFDM